MSISTPSRDVIAICISFTNTDLQGNYKEVTNG
jgi:hypothetical protein